MPHPPTMQDVAEVAGVHRTTVSLALRDSPKLPAATRARVQAVAKRLGYRPDPLVSALMTARVNRRHPVHQGTLAFLSNDAKRPPDWARFPKSYGRLFRGAAARATERGYDLAPFWLREPGVDGATFSRHLIERGIHGLLIAPHSGADNRIDLDWSRFAVVELGYNLVAPQVNRVVHDYFSAMQRVWHEARARGHRRIGFALPHNAVTKTRFLWRAAFIDAQQSLPQDARLPILAPAHLTQDAIDPWLERERPDAVIIGGIQYPSNPPDMRIPRRIPVFNLDCVHRDASDVGIFQDWPAMGALGVDLLIGQLGRSEYGVPVQPYTVLVAGHWQG
jgi:LacI family transcriptional regulator